MLSGMAQETPVGRIARRYAGWLSRGGLRLHRDLVRDCIIVLGLLGALIAFFTTDFGAAVHAYVTG